MKNLYKTFGLSFIIDFFRAGSGWKTHGIITTLQPTCIYFIHFYLG